MTKAEKKIAAEEIGEAAAGHAEYMDSLTPEAISARNAAMASANGLDEFDIFYIEESTRALAGR